MAERRLNILGMGVVTDEIGHIGELSSAARLQKMDVLDPSSVIKQDSLTQLALRAAHQAWTMADPAIGDPERTGLIMQTEWGAIDSTVAYLDSMLEAEGKYASPRHFSRSVYSSVASAAAIHFGIKGPCETLTFDRFPIHGSLVQAWRFLGAKRCDRVLLIWGEQNGNVACHLARLAGEKLGIPKFRRYLKSDLGAGAVAVLVGSGAGIASLDIDQWDERAALEIKRRPFAMDGAVDLVTDILSSMPRL